MRTEKMNYYFPIGLFLAMFLDGGLTQVFAKYMFTNTMAMESRLVLLFIVMAVCYGNVEHLVMWSAIVGLFYDMFYTGILGVFTMILPLMVYVTKYMFQFFTRSIEVNEGYSLASYGLYDIRYAKLLAARWAELTDTVDECAFALDI